MTEIFKVRATVTSTYEYEVYGDTIEEVVEFVEDGEMEEDCVEIDSGSPVVVEYAVEGQMGWLPRPEQDSKSWFTVWVSEAGSHGTHFIEAFRAEGPEDAKSQAILECAACWDWPVDELEILGVVEGEVCVIEWNEDSA